MAAHYARNAYLQAQVQPETDPKRLILMLYEGALKHLRLAQEGIQAHHAQKRGENLSRAVAIVSTLHSSLEGEVTDEPIAFLRGLYQAILIELNKVAITHDVNMLDLAFRYLERLKQIWERDVMGLPSQTPQEQSQVAAPAAASPAVPHLVLQRPAYGAAPVAGRRALSVYNP